MVKENKITTSKVSATPGPWYIEEHNPGEFDITSGEGGKIIAMADCEGKEAKANAHLIAAAPELLEALKLVRDKYQEHFENMPVAWQSVDNIIEAAIAKAEGKNV